jgi:hypothetical protein
MESVLPGELVKVSTGGPWVDGIVFDVPSRSKVVVAVVDEQRGPVFRTVPADALAERAEEGSDDRALQLLLRRTPAPPARGASRGATGGARARAAHGRGAAHRPTGK